MDFFKLKTNMVNEILTLYDDKWENISLNDDYVVYQKNIVDSLINMFRIDMKMNINHNDFHKYVHEKMDSVSSNKDTFSYNIENIKRDNGINILLANIKLQFPLYARDFCLFFVDEKINDDTCVIILKSIENEAFPVRKNFIRGDMKICGYVCKKIDENNSMISYIIDVDPKGWIPSNLVNYEIKRNVSDLNKLKTILENKI